MKVATAMVLGLALGAAGTQARSPAQSERVSLAGQLRSADGTVLGTASVRTVTGRGELRVSVSKLTPGLHGLHFHNVGKCEAPDFASAGPHWNPTGKQHGLRNPLGAHVGDLPNLRVAANGKGSARIPLKLTLGEARELASRALIVHAGADDERTDPSGNSGGRQLCAVLQPTVR